MVGSQCFPEHPPSTDYHGDAILSRTLLASLYYIGDFYKFEIFGCNSYIARLRESQGRIETMDEPFRVGFPLFGFNPVDLHTGTLFFG